jgi:hypothetical protein
MSAPSIVAELAPSNRQEHRRLGSLLSDYWALTKPEVNFLILITTGAGFYLGCRNGARPFSFVALFNTLLGTLLVASGTGTLNQYIERKVRCANAPYRAAPCRSQTSQPYCRSGFRNCAGWGRNCVSCRRGQSAGEYARNFNVADLSVRVHPAKAKNAAMYAGRGLSGRHAASHRLAAASGD